MAGSLATLGGRMWRRLAEIGRRVADEQRVTHVTDTCRFAALAAGRYGFGEAAFTEDGATVATVNLQEEERESCGNCKVFDVTNPNLSSGDSKR